jgi:hypothetical protein
MGLKHLHPSTTQPSRGSFGTYGATTTKNVTQHPKNGARAGLKSGHKIVGKKMPGVLNKTMVLPNAGRMGAK